MLDSFMHLVVRRIEEALLNSSPYHSRVLLVRLPLNTSGNLVGMVNV